jgi:hypothetical protein
MLRRHDAGVLTYALALQHMSELEAEIPRRFKLSGSLPHNAAIESANFVARVKDAVHLGKVSSHALDSEAPIATAGLF